MPVVVAEDLMVPLMVSPQVELVVKAVVVKALSLHLLEMEPTDLAAEKVELVDKAAAVAAALERSQLIPLILLKEHFL